MKQIEKPNRSLTRNIEGFVKMLHSWKKQLTK